MSFYAANENKANYVSFNQDYQILGVAHQGGYMFYKTCDILKSDSALEATGEMATERKQVDLRNLTIVERLFSTGLVVLVTKNDPRALQVYKIGSGQIITQPRFAKKVLAVRINNQRLLVVFDDSMHVFDSKTIKKLHTINNVPQGTEKVFDMSTSNGTALVAYPVSREHGTICLFDAIQLDKIANISAHESQLACVKFNANGTMFATASSRGTVIRVFSVSSGEMSHEFRRGATRFVSTSSMCFSEDSQFLCSASNTETVHVYKLEKEKEQESESYSDKWMKTLKSVTNYMPSSMKNVSDLITGERSFAFARLPLSGTGTKVAISKHNGQNFVVVATLEGQVFVFNISKDGGEIPLVSNQHIGPLPEPHRYIAQKSDNNENYYN